MYMYGIGGLWDCKCISLQTRKQAVLDVTLNENHVLWKGLCEESCV
jgi:hypothetical protein